ncbi:MAG: S8 family serine peptidase [Methanobacteriota archaeon]
MPNKFLRRCVCVTITFSLIATLFSINGFAKLKTDEIFPVYYRTIQTDLNGENQSTNLTRSTTIANSESWNLTGLVLVKFYTMPENINLLANALNTTIFDIWNDSCIIIFKVCNSTLNQHDKYIKLNIFIDKITKHASVELVESDRMVVLDYHFIPNDPRYSTDQWGLKRINVPEAWDKTRGNEQVVVAIMDSGIDYTHEDLTSNMWNNPGEKVLDTNGENKSTNNIDDDNNGYVDDYYGFDFIDSSTRVNPITGNNEQYEYTGINGPMDEYVGEYHGTYCAGIVGARINNNIGISGVANCKLMAIRLGGGGSGTNGLDMPPAVSSVALWQSLRYVKDNANIISMSFGWYDISPTFNSLLVDAWNNGCLVIAASGNNEDGGIGLTNNGKSYVPASYDSVIAVGATTTADMRATPTDWIEGCGSNYGPRLDVMAPGTSIVGTIANNNYIPYSGTSAAAPLVAGVAALIWSYRPSLTNAEVRAIINVTATDLIYASGQEIAIDGWDRYTGYGQVNAQSCLNFIDSYNPGEVILNPPNVRATSSVKVTWTKYNNNANDFVYYRIWGEGRDTYGNPYILPQSGTIISDINTKTFTFNQDIYPNHKYKIWIEVASSNWGVSSSNVIWSRAIPLDAVSPINPTSYSSDRSINTWSNDNTILISWSGASDADSGVYGYSIEWSTNPSTIPDATSDTGGTSTTSNALSDGTNWYLHIRTRDNAGNWNPGAYHVGPFKIDTVAPTNPTSYTSNPPVNAWSSDNTIDVSWSGASDAGGSGVAGYSTQWSTSATTIPDTTVDIASTVTSTTSPAQADGNNIYFHIRTKDNAGNWNGNAYHIGPFWIDTIPLSCSIIINNYNEYTATTSVSLSLTYKSTGAGVWLARYSNDGTWDTELWENPSLTKAWILTAGSGTKIVYYQVLDYNGYVATSSDTIVLDMTPPTASAYINDGAEYTPSQSVTLTLSASDSGIGLWAFRYCSDGIGWSDWVNFYNYPSGQIIIKNWILSPVVGTKQ